MSEIMNEQQAREVTDQLKKVLRWLESRFEDILVGKPWVALGYASMGEWWVGEGLNNLSLSSETRDKLILALSGDGMSVRQIAGTVGVSVGTAHNAVKGVQNRTDDLSKRKTVQNRTDNLSKRKTVQNGALEEKAIIIEGELVEDMEVYFNKGVMQERDNVLAYLNEYLGYRTLLANQLRPIMDIIKNIQEGRHDKS